MIERLLRLLRRALPPRASALLRRRRYRSVTHCAREALAEADRLVRRGHVVVLLKGTHPTWLVALCPCRCGEILRVNLMTTAEPAWRVTVSARGRTTVWPSLIVTPCGSHFWVTDGRVRWT